MSQKRLYLFFLNDTSYVIPFPGKMVSDVCQIPQKRLFRMSDWNPTIKNTANIFVKIQMVFYILKFWWHIHSNDLFPFAVISSGDHNNFYILIREGIRFMQNGGPPPPVFVNCPRFETLWTRKNGFRECVCLSVCVSVCRF